MERGKKFSPAEIQSILTEVAGGASLEVIVTTHGITRQRLARWLKANSETRPEDAVTLRFLQEENQRLKRIVARQALEIDAYREVTDTDW